MHVIALLSFFVLVSVSQSQPFPYLTFNGTRLANHSYVSLDDIRNELTPFGVECHTDLNPCCRNNDGYKAGAWYFPNGTQLSFDFTDPSSVYMKRGTQRVLLYQRRYHNASIFGIYHCKVPINTNVTIGINYVGIYKGNTGTDTH